MKVKEESTPLWEEGRAEGGMMPRYQYHFADAADDDGDGDGDGDDDDCDDDNDVS